MTDWDKIEERWRFSGDSTRKIAKDEGLSEGAIRKRAKAEGWVKGEVAAVRQPVPPKEERERPKVSQVPDTVEPMDKTIELAVRMLGELDATSMCLVEIEELIYLETQDDRDPRRRNAMLKAVSLPTRAITLKTIQQTLSAASESSKPAGKKGERQAAAQQAAGGGKFAPPKPPKLVVNNK